MGPLGLFSPGYPAGLSQPQGPNQASAPALLPRDVTHGALHPLCHDDPPHPAPALTLFTGILHWHLKIKNLKTIKRLDFPQSVPVSVLPYSEPFPCHIPIGKISSPPHRPKVLRIIPDSSIPTSCIFFSSRPCGPSLHPKCPDVLQLPSNKKG